MVQLLVFLLSLCQLKSLTFSESVDTPNLSANSLSSDEFTSISQPELPPSMLDYPIVKSAGDNTEIDFEDPITSVNIDYLNNAIILQFKKQRQKQQQALNKNFMRFGRSDKNLMRFGKRQMENFPDQMSADSSRTGNRFERSNGVEGMRDSRGDNFMRFGRTTGGSKSLMRFGRSPSDFMRFGRSPSDFMRFGRSSGDFMRFGRSPSDFMRFGRSPSDFMRFGRSPSDFMRFGRSPSDFMRFGRAPSDFMRFGRTPTPNQNLMRFGRSNGMMRFGRNDMRSDSIDNNFMRFGRLDSFMRFGRSPNTETATNTNFMRLGKREKDTSNTTEQNHTEKIPKSQTSTTSPFQELDNDVEPLDMMFLNDLTDSMANDEN